VKYRCELAPESGEIVHSDAGVTADEEQHSDTSKSNDQNAGGNGGETDNAGYDSSDTSEAKNTGDVMEVNGSTDITLSQKNISDTDAPCGLDQLKQAEKLESSLNEAEQREPDTFASSTTADQSVCRKPPTNTDTEVLQPEDVKLNEIHDDDLDVIDLSKVTVQCSSSHHVTVCFEVCILQFAVCMLTVWIRYTYMLMKMASRAGTVVPVF